MASDTKSGSAIEHFRTEFMHLWREMPGAALFCILLGAWFLFFHFLGNSTLGYVNSHSLWNWLHWVYNQTEDDAIGFYIPLLVLGLLWLKRSELLAIKKSVWWPAILLFIIALLLHILGYRVQQNRISLISFFTGLYAFLGLFWGWRMLQKTFFPFFLFVFNVPIANHTEFITFPLRLIATYITTAISHTVLGIDIIQRGTQLLAPDNSYHYEVAAACSGIRSLTVIFLLATVIGFLSYKTITRRLAVVFLAVPLAVAANVIRLCTVIIAAEAFGQQSGNDVHESWWMSLLPYALAITVLLLATRAINRWWPENEEPGSPKPEGPLILAPPEKAS